jgi:hypothetical protein
MLPNQSTATWIEEEFIAAPDEPALSCLGRSDYWAYVMGAWDEWDHHVGLTGVLNHQYRAPVTREFLCNCNLDETSTKNNRNYVKPLNKPVCEA